MSRPKAYDPQPGYRFQILCRNQSYDREWEHCDYAETSVDRKFLVQEYRLAYGPGWEFKSIPLPMKYWPKKTPVATTEQWTPQSTTG
jgi:hypothetical protein